MLHEVAAIVYYLAHARYYSKMIISSLQMVRRKRAHQKMMAKISQENKRLKLWQETLPFFSIQQNSTASV